LFSFTHASKEKLTLLSMKVDNGPDIDGKLNEECWQKAQQAVDLLYLAKSEKVQENSQTVVMSCYDDKYVYFGLKMFEPNTDKLNLVSAPGQYGNDAPEIFLSHRNIHTDRCNFIMNVAGDKLIGFFDAPGSSSAKFGTKPEQDSVISRVKIHKEYWTLEMAIPFLKFFDAVPKHMETWGFNVVRKRMA
jgi:hypothetical protein